jgi:hypothetical protein
MCMSSSAKTTVGPHMSDLKNNLKHTTAIINSPGASVRPKHRSDTTESCMKLQMPIRKIQTHAIIKKGKVKKVEFQFYIG